MTTYRAAVASTERHVLAEGPVWVPVTQQVLWVDVARGHVFEGRLDAERIEQTARHDFEGTVGAVVRSDDGHLLVAGQERLLVLAPTGERILGPRVVGAGRSSRTNDGACDPAGRFLVGTLSLAGEAGSETLLRVEDDATVTTLDGDLTLSNGLAWSPDGQLLYSIDTMPGVVWVRGYDAQTGRVGERRVLLRIADGLPDGMCVDSAGRLWIALWGAGEVRSFSPEGVHLDTVRVDAPHVSSVAFVGPDLDLLLVTTASRDLTAHERRLFPDAGRLFTARVGAAGAPCSSWSGSWLARARRAAGSGRWPVRPRP